MYRNTFQYFFQAAGLNATSSNVNDILTRLQALTNPSRSQNLSSGDILAANSILQKILNTEEEKPKHINNAFVSQRQRYLLLTSFFSFILLNYLSFIVQSV